MYKIYALIDTGSSTQAEDLGSMKLRSMADSAFVKAQAERQKSIIVMISSTGEIINVARYQDVSEKAKERA